VKIRKEKFTDNKIIIIKYLKRLKFDVVTANFLLFVISPLHIITYLNLEEKKCFFLICLVVCAKEDGKKIINLTT